VIRAGRGILGRVMARPLRIEFAGALYHLTSRGNERRNIFRSDRDRRAFLAFLGVAAKRFGWSVTAWVLIEKRVRRSCSECLIDNHRTSTAGFRKANRQADHVILLPTASAARKGHREIDLHRAKTENRRRGP
jgi:hypothetical protein